MDGELRRHEFASRAGMASATGMCYIDPKVFTMELASSLSRVAGVCHPNSTTSVLPAEETQSPVEWQVLVFAILALAINSIAQPSGYIEPSIPKRFRLYLCSSPIVCMCDAVAMLLQLVATMIYLWIPLSTAFIVVVYGRCENMIQNLGIDGEEDQEDKSYLSFVWPRWLFFAVGVLPASIKLASLSGIPWTKMFGMMFLSSFLVIELFNLIAHNVLRSRLSIDDHPLKSLRTMDLGTSGQWEMPIHLAISLFLPEFSSVSTSLFLSQQPVGRKGTLGEDAAGKQFARALQLIATVSFGLALVAHLGLLVWAAESVWLTANITIRAKSACEIPGNLAVLFLDLATDILKVMEESLKIAHLQNALASAAWLPTIPIPDITGLNSTLLSIQTSIREGSCHLELQSALRLLRFIQASTFPASETSHQLSEVLVNLEDKASTYCGEPPLLKIFSILLSIMLMLLTPPAVALEFLVFLGWASPRWRLVAGKLWVWIFFGTGVRLLLPDHYQQKPEGFSKYKLRAFVCVWILDYFFAWHFIFQRAFKWQPWIGRVLLVLWHPPEDKVKVQPEPLAGRVMNFDESENLEMEPLVELDVTEVDVSESINDLEFGPTAEPETKKKVDNFELTVEPFALCFFVTNLLVFVLWYAYEYDQTGTINPSWTHVFG
ncbi:hypothetical protein VTL71DRAFT_1296 [Oculimacula yallundae]|uniref:Uncharacterized protein n=1 Tax=Oculimacula yallundae TaxID=86028 RepID=A0ABR4CBG7_9HELO